MRTGGVSPARGAQSRGESFEGFFAREAHSQVQRATLLVGSPEDANDIVQEALTRLYQRWGELEDPGPYLNRTVLNLCRDHGRRAVTRRRLLVRLREPGVVSPGHEVLDDLLDGLPCRQRAAVVLRFWGGLSTTEIAEQLGCAPGSVGTWISRATRRMRKALP